ncbi:hypothetical protein H4R27_003073 [Coemansia aciculifera]|nr:hypothetical protein H4R27_003073 [Coemansia aciculifera]
MTKRKASTSVGSGAQEDTEHGSCTPRVLRSGSSGVTQNTLTTAQQISTERHNEASIHYEQRLDKDQDFILNWTLNDKTSLRRLSKRQHNLWNRTSTLLSSLGQSVEGMDVADESHPDSPMLQLDTSTDPGTSTQKTGITVDNSPLLNEKPKEAQNWISWQSIGNEKAMYGPMGAFIEYVALIVQEKLNSLTGPSSSNGLGCRLVLPSTKADYKPPDADNSMRIDMGLARANINDPIDISCGRFSYYELLAVLEAKLKGDGNGFSDAFLQLDIYTRQLYQQQHSLRFAWGVTVSGTHVRVGHFGPDKAKSSCRMDVSMPEGRRAFVEVLVNRSLCEESQLGRDPTM